MFHPDRCLHADVGMKQDLLHMLLLSYNHTWLKLGLEVNISYSLGGWLGGAVVYQARPISLAHWKLCKHYGRLQLTVSERNGSSSID